MCAATVTQWRLEKPSGLICRALQKLQIIIIIISNHMSHIHDGTFSMLSKLLILDLSFSDFSTFQPKVFSGLQELQYLKLRASSISDLHEGAFSGLSNLLHLELCVNSLSSLYNDWVT